MRRTVVTVVALAALPLAARAQEPRHLTLAEATALAEQQSAGIRAMRGKVEEMRHASAALGANAFPVLATQINYMQNTQNQGITIPRGSFGDVPELGGLFPGVDLNIDQGGTSLFYTMTTLAQPVTQLYRIHQGRGAAEADEVIAEAQLRRTENQVRVGVLQAYAGLLLAENEREIARVRLQTAQQRTSYRKVAAQAGSVLAVAETEARVAELQARQKVLEAENQVDDVRYSLLDLLGLPQDTRLELEAPETDLTELLPLETYVDLAMERHPDLMEARATVAKADYGVRAAWSDYIPDFSLVGTHLYQSSVPFLPHNSLGVGFRVDWTILDFGKRSNALGQRHAQRDQAQANLERVQGQVRGEVEKAYRSASRSLQLVEIAREAETLRTEAARIQENQRAAGFILAADAGEAAADAAQGRLDLVKAQVGYRLAVAELMNAVGAPLQ